MYHIVFRYEYLTFQTQIHLHKQYIFHTKNIQSEYALLFPFSIYFYQRTMFYNFSYRIFGDESDVLFWTVALYYLRFYKWSPKEVKL